MGAVTPGYRVLDTRVELQKVWDHPSDNLKWFTKRYMEDILKATEGENVTPVMAYMFWPAKTVTEFSALISRQLRSALTYQVTAEMVDAVQSTYEHVVGKTGHIEEREMPAPSGFAYLDKPLEFKDAEGEVTTFRAISWCLQAPTFMDGFLDREGWGGVRICAWSNPHDNRGESAYPEEALDEFDKLGPLMLTHSSIVPFRQRFMPRKLGEEPVTMDDVHRWLHCLWMWLQAEITVTRPSDSLSRPVRRRAQRTIKHGEVRVILLRRVHNAAEPSGRHRDIDWSCRWVVQGHDRHLGKYEGPRHHADPAGADKHCAVCLGRTTYVHAYIKGPDGKPLRSAEQLYRLAR